MLGVLGALAELGRPGAAAARRGGRRHRFEPAHRAALVEAAERIDLLVVNAGTLRPSPELRERGLAG